MIALLKNNPAALLEILRRLLSTRIARYGEVSALVCEPGSGRIDLTLTLAGEADPVSIALGGCAVYRQGGEAFFRAASVRAGRVWLHNLLIDHPQWLVFPVPEEFGTVLEFLFPPKANP